MLTERADEGRYVKASATMREALVRAVEQVLVEEDTMKAGVEPAVLAHGHQDSAGIVAASAILEDYRGARGAGEVVYVEIRLRDKTSLYVPVDGTTAPSD
jgi:hypothetical protein